MPVAVTGVCEPQVASVVVLLDVVQAGEVPTVEVVDQHAGCVGGRIDDRELGRVDGIALIAEYNLLAFAAVGGGADGVES